MTIQRIDGNDDRRLEGGRRHGGRRAAAARHETATLARGGEARRVKAEGEVEAHRDAAFAAALHYSLAERIGDVADCNAAMPW